MADERDAGALPFASDLREAQVIKHGPSFLLTDRRGDVHDHPASAAYGLYHHDTRHLSRLELEVDGLRPMLLYSSVDKGYSQVTELGYPLIGVDPNGLERRESVSISRTRLIADALLERIEVVNRGREPRVVRLTFGFDADFADVFEVRGHRRRAHGQPQPVRTDRHAVTFAYRGADGLVRATTLRFSPAPHRLTERSAELSLPVGPGESADVGLEIVPQRGATPPPRRAFREVRQDLERDYTKWRKSCTRFRTSNPLFSQFLSRGIRDLRMLTSHDGQGRPALEAGVPWFSATFGRDSLITAYEFLPVNPALAWQALRRLAAHQGRRSDPSRGEEPGKIPHELRVGELASAGEVGGAPNYGSVDSTPLWLTMLGQAYAWTADLAAARELWPNALAALEWAERHGDVDGDGYVECAGPDDRGWKDSRDAITGADGLLPEGPIALVEVQGYLYMAKTGLARVARALGDAALGERLAREAAELKERFNRDFWVEELGFYALALDGRKRPVATAASNAGQALWTGIVAPERAERVARRLRGNGLSCGWGIRTLARAHPSYDPMSYHSGSVWPHDTALIAHGLKLSGRDIEAIEVADELAAAGAGFPLGRFPELFCGFSSRELPEPIAYPGACRPQAWAAGAPMLLLRTYTGLAADAPARELSIIRPRLPQWLDRVEILGMRVGESRVDLVFTRTGAGTAVHVPRKEGEVEVVIRR